MLFLHIGLTRSLRLAFSSRHSFANPQSCYTAHSRTHRVSPRLHLVLLPETEGVLGSVEPPTLLAFVRTSSRAKPLTLVRVAVLAVPRPLEKSFGSFTDTALNSPVVSSMLLNSTLRLEVLSCPISVTQHAGQEHSSENLRFLGSRSRKSVDDSCWACFQSDVQEWGSSEESRRWHYIFVSLSPSAPSSPFTTNPCLSIPERLTAQLAAWNVRLSLFFPLADTETEKHQHRQRRSGDLLSHGKTRCPQRAMFAMSPPATRLTGS